MALGPPSLPFTMWCPYPRTLPCVISHTMKREALPGTSSGWSPSDRVGSITSNSPFPDACRASNSDGFDRESLSSEVGSSRAKPGFEGKALANPREMRERSARSHTSLGQKPSSVSGLCLICREPMAAKRACEDPGVGKWSRCAFMNAHDLPSAQRTLSIQYSIPILS